jgi:hypothetical protein
MAAAALAVAMRLELLERQTQAAAVAVLEAVVAEVLGQQVAQAS